MSPSDDATSSHRKKRRTESKEDLSTRESSRLRIDDPAEEREEAKNRSMDGTDLSCDLVAPDVLAARTLSPASLRRSWARHSVESGGKRVCFVDNDVSGHQVSDLLQQCLETLLTFSSALPFGFFLPQVAT
jgi:hypothetical protein